jgi:ribonuclease HII
MTDATLATERALADEGARYILGVDEVGRGALAGPVNVGAVLIDMTITSHLAGVRDSKALSPRRRSALVPHIEAWCAGFAVGQATNDEIDELGIMGALTLAARRALEGFNRIDAVVLDGQYNWLGDVPGAKVVNAVGADARDLSVAAASVLAKVQRDAYLVDLHDRAPVYGWARNKGYGSPEHLAAVRSHGLSRWHRHTWRIRGASTVVT